MAEAQPGPAAEPPIVAWIHTAAGPEPTIEARNVYLLGPWLTMAMWRDGRLIWRTIPHTEVIGIRWAEEPDPYGQPVGLIDATSYARVHGGAA
jgi:hypothetical protein